MRKILLIADGLFKDYELESKDIQDRFKRFAQYGVTLDVARDSVFVLGNDMHEYISKIEHEGPEWATPPEELMRKMQDAEVVLVHFSALGSKPINCAQKLKFIGVCRSGAENVNLDAAREKGVSVSNAPGRVSEPVADFAVALMLNIGRGISRMELRANRGVWHVPTGAEHDKLLCMRNRVVGFVGFGVIGRKVARRLEPFGCRFLVYDPYCSADSLPSDGYSLVGLDELMQNADYVSLHARLTESTRHLIGARELAFMKPDAFFINTARSGLVDTAALIDVLREKRIQGAALDVFDEEPLSEDSPLLQLDNVLLTPHLAGQTGDTLSNSIDIMLEELERYFKGEPLKNRLV